MMIDQAFDLVGDARCTLLVLGSFPGVRSLAAARYYAHPRNQFWRLMSPVAGVDLVSLDYAERLDALVGRGIGLWDVVASADRVGSLDSALRNVAPRDLQAVAAQMPQLQAMAFNGAAAYRIRCQQMAIGTAIKLVLLPSSSAAHTLPIADKAAVWGQLATFVET